MVSAKKSLAYSDSENTDLVISHVLINSKTLVCIIAASLVLAYKISDMHGILEGALGFVGHLNS